MAIIKMVNVKAGKPYGLKAVLDYITQMGKTDDRKLVSGKDCMTETAYKEMLLVKQNFHQLKGRQYIHIIQSFPADEKLSPQLAHSIGKQLISQLGDFQGVVATHIDRRHIHNHIVLNSVNFETGKKWQFSKEQLYQLRAYSDKLCLDNGLSVIEKGKGWKSYGEHKGGSWKEFLAFHIAQSLKKCYTPDEMCHYFRNRGMDLEFRKNDILFTLQDGKKCSNTKLMSYGDFSKDNIAKHLKLNHLYLRESKYHTDFIKIGLQEIASLFVGRTTADVVNDYFSGRLPALEGAALTEWILKKKNGADFKYGAWVKQPQQESGGNLLKTMDSILADFENAERERARRLQEQQFEDEEDYEWEMD